MENVNHKGQISLQLLALLLNDQSVVAGGVKLFGVDQLDPVDVHFLVNEVHANPRRQTKRKHVLLLDAFPGTLADLL